jgi:hypothetical protein
MAKSVEPFWAFVWHFQIHLTFSFFISNLLDLTSSSKLFLTYYPLLCLTLCFSYDFILQCRLAPFEQITRDIKGLLNVWKWNGSDKGSKGAVGGPQCFTKLLGVRTYIYIACFKVHPKVQFCLFCNEPLWLEPWQRKKIWNFQTLCLIESLESQNRIVKELLFCPPIRSFYFEQRLWDTVWCCWEHLREHLGNLRKKLKMHWEHGRNIRIQKIPTLSPTLPPSLSGGTHLCILLQKLK